MSDLDNAEAIPTTRPLFGSKPAEAVPADPAPVVPETVEAAPVDAAVTQQGIEDNAAATLADANAYGTRLEDAEDASEAVVEPAPEAEAAPVDVAPAVEPEAAPEVVAEDTVTTSDVVSAGNLAEAGEVVEADPVVEAEAEVDDEAQAAPAVAAEPEETVTAPLDQLVSDGSTASASTNVAGQNTDGTTTDNHNDVEALEAERDALDARIKAQRDAEKNEVLVQIKTVMQSFGVTTEDVVNYMGDYKPKRQIAKAVPKYKDPATGVTWSGRGKAPAWIKDKNYADFLI